MPSQRQLEMEGQDDLFEDEEDEDLFENDIRKFCEQFGNRVKVYKRFIQRWFRKFILVIEIYDKELLDTIYDHINELKDSHDESYGIQKILVCEATIIIIPSVTD